MIGYPRKRGDAALDWPALPSRRPPDEERYLELSQGRPHCTNKTSWPINRSRTQGRRRPRGVSTAERVVPRRNRSQSAAVLPDNGPPNGGTDCTVCKEDSPRRAPPHQHCSYPNSRWCAHRLGGTGRCRGAHKQTQLRSVQDACGAHEGVAQGDTRKTLSNPLAIREP